MDIARSYKKLMNVSRLAMFSLGTWKHETLFYESKQLVTLVGYTNSCVTTARIFVVLPKTMNNDVNVILAEIQASLIRWF